MCFLCLKKLWNTVLSCLLEKSPDDILMFFFLISIMLSCFAVLQHSCVLFVAYFPADNNDWIFYVLSFIENLFSILEMVQTLSLLRLPLRFWYLFFTFLVVFFFSSWTTFIYYLFLWLTSKLFKKYNKQGSFGESG